MSHHHKFQPLRCAVLVLSDKGSQGLREDLSGPALVQYLKKAGHKDVLLDLLPDEMEQIRSRLIHWADADGYDLILTCGGTGVSARDVTPEATALVLDREMPGFGERMRAVSMEKSPHAIVSRALAGTRGGSLIINLPGSPRAALENLEAVWPAVGHLVAKLQGDQTDSGSDSLGSGWMFGWPILESIPAGDHLVRIFRNSSEFNGLLKKSSIPLLRHNSR